MKKKICLIMSCMMLFSLIGCSVSEETIIRDVKEEVVNMGKEYIDEQIESETSQFINKMKEQVSGVLEDISDFSNIFSKIEGEECEHDKAYKYLADENIVVCRCGKETIEVKLYEDFKECLKINWNPLTWFRTDKYCMRTFVVYRGVDPALLDVAEKVNIEYDEVSIEMLEKLAETVDCIGSAMKDNSIYAEIVKDAEVEKVAETMSEYMGTLSSALTITKFTVHFKEMMEQKENPSETCMELIDCVDIVAGDLPYFSSMLKILYPTLEMYRESLEYHWNAIEYNSLGTLSHVTVDGVDLWCDLCFYNKWEELTYVHIMDIAKDEELHLPSLNEILEKYPECTKEDKIFADKYILFCLEKIFERTLGITYDEYVKCISNIK